MCKIEDIKIGNHLRFERYGVKDFRMYWTVIGFTNGLTKKMIRIKIDEMGYKDEIDIDIEDVTALHDVNDTRYVNNGK